MFNSELHYPPSACVGLLCALSDNQIEDVGWLLEYCAYLIGVF